jgi:alpha-1,6-mannosyltransferase
MDRPERDRRAAARARAELFGWPQAVDGFLRAHGAPPATATPAIGRQHTPQTSLRPAVPMTSRAWAHQPAGADDTSAARYA